MSTPTEFTENYNAWRANLLLNDPDTSVDAYKHYLEAEDALAKLKENE